MRRVARVHPDDTSLVPSAGRTAIAVVACTDTRTGRVVAVGPPAGTAIGSAAGTPGIAAGTRRIVL